MLGAGHHWTGALMGVAVCGLAARFGGHLPGYALPAVFLAGWYGGVAPDRLEFRRGRNTLIPHRTITHLMLFWGLTCAFVGASLIGGAAWVRDYPAVSWILLGFLMGGLTHILVDWPNPLGVPLWHPGRRHSLRWWRSGQYEVTIILVFVLMAWAAWGFPAPRRLP